MQKKSSNSKKGCLFLIVGTLAVMAGVAIFTFLTGQITGALVEARYGGTNTYVLLTASVPCIAVCFVLLEAILFLQYIPGEGDYAKDQNLRQPMLNQPKMPTYSKKVINLICLGILGVVVLCGFVSANTYTVVSDEGISSRFFVETSNYKWHQVTSYTIDCDGNKGLSVTYTMRDGKKFEVLQNTVSATKTFKEQHGSATAYALHVDTMLQELQISKNVRHMETAVSFYRNKMPDTWVYVSKLIGYEAVIPLPDEVPETTETETDVTETTN
jgi:hypothetical protein